MGHPVTVDSDDLQTLLFATGCVKAMENVLRPIHEDILYQQAEPLLTGAHDRLAAELNRSRRTKPFEGALIKSLYDSLAAEFSEEVISGPPDALRKVRLWVREREIPPTEEISTYLALERRLGLVEMASHRQIVFWPSGVENRPKASMLFRLTPSATSAIEDYEQAEKNRLASE